MRRFFSLQAVLEFERRKAAAAQAERDKAAAAAAAKAEAERLALLEEGPKAIKRKEKLLRQILELEVTEGPREVECGHLG